MNCPKCGKTIKNGAQFCPYCGYRNDTYATVKADDYSMKSPSQVGFVQQPVSQPMKKQPKKSGKKLIIAVVAVVLALAVAGASVFFLFFNKKSESSNNNAATSAANVRAVHGIVHADNIKLDTAGGVSLAVYAVSVDPETGRATVSSEPVAKTVTDENGEYEFELAPGNYIVQTDDDIPSYRQSFTVPEEKVTSSGDESEKKKPLEVEKLVAETGSGFDTGYKNGEFVEYNGIAYYTDKNGLHRDNGSKTTVLDDRKCEFLATDGETIYYTVFNKRKLGNDSLAEYDQYDMYSINTDGTNKKKTFSFKQNGKPILADNNKLYYLEMGYMNNSTLKSYESDSEISSTIHENVRPEVTLINDRIIMRSFATDVSNKELYYYDIKTEKLVDTNMEVIGFDDVGDKLYYWQYNEYHTGNMSRREEEVGCFDADDISESGARPIVKLEEKFVQYIDKKYIYYTKNNEYGDTEYCRYNIADEKEEAILTDVEYGYSINSYKNGVAYVPESDFFYYLDNNSDNTVLYQTEKYIPEGHFMGIVGEYVYSKEYGDDGSTMSRVRILNSGEESKSKDWEKLYIELLEKGDFDESVDSSENDGYTYASLVYIDSDNVPELIVASMSTAPGYRMYWVKDGELKGYDLSAAQGMGYAEKGGLIYLGSMHQGIVHWGNYTFDGNEVERVLYGAYIPENEGTPESYEINGEKVSKEEYESEKEEYRTDKTVPLDYTIDEMITRLKKGSY